MFGFLKPSSLCGRIDTKKESEGGVYENGVEGIRKDQPHRGNIGEIVCTGGGTFVI